jgi:hypothetical protein
MASPSRRGKLERSVPTISAPTAPQTIREKILALAGVDDAVLAALTKRAVEVAQEGMQATKVQRLAVSQGRGEPSRVEEFVDIDHQTRLAASDRVHDLVGTRAPKSSEGQGKAGLIQQINVYIDGQLHGEPIDASPALDVENAE